MEVCWSDDGVSCFLWINKIYKDFMETVVSCFHIFLLLSTTYKQFNPFYPDISLHILLAAFHTFPNLLTMRICSTFKSLFSWWLFPLQSILVTFLFDSEMSHCRVNLTRKFCKAWRTNITSMFFILLSI